MLLNVEVFMSDLGPMKHYKGLFLFGVLLFSLATYAQSPADASPTVEGGKELVLKKCAQCHTDSIWRDQRQDERAWEATLYRMMGRGAIWTKDEMKSMAMFLGNDFGNQATKVKSN
jgi:mono/diheme cytochrome c family protein